MTGRGLYALQWASGVYSGDPWPSSPLAVNAVIVRFMAVLSRISPTVAPALVGADGLDKVRETVYTASAAMTHPYATLEYGESLRHLGEPIRVAEWGTTVLRRKCGLGHYDALGTYPIMVFKPDCDLAGGLVRLTQLGLVSAVLVVDDSLRAELPALQAFDFVRPFKQHFLYERSRSPIPYSKHHRYEIRRARAAVRVERFELAEHLAAWIDLYQSLVARRGLERTMHAFPRAHHEALAQLPGVIAIGAFANDRLVSCHVWICHKGHAMSHLAASSEEGYALRAAYAVNAGAIELIGECRTLNFGGAAGSGDDDEAGLARFKRGFSNAVAASYLCGKVLARDAYCELLRRAGVPIDASYFPAYRQPVAAAADDTMTRRPLGA